MKFQINANIFSLFLFTKKKITRWKLFNLYENFQWNPNKFNFVLKEVFFIFTKTKKKKLQKSEIILIFNCSV